MLGAIIGDIAGSRFEWHNRKSKEFEIFHKNSRFTDDTVMTIAIGKAVMESTRQDGSISLELLEENAVKWMQKIGRHYPHCGYGGNFKRWMYSDNPKSYNSYGNGAAMRVSACGEAAINVLDAKYLARTVTAVTHNHSEGMRGAQAVAATIFLAKEGMPKDEIRKFVDAEFYKLDFTLDEIRDDYEFDVSCQGSVPQALVAFFESESFEDAIRNAVSIGGDSDTIAAITGSIAESYYGIPGWMIDKAMGYLNHHLREIVYDWYHSRKVPSVIEDVSWSFDTYLN